MPPILTLLLFSIWALLCVRLICFRSTLSGRTVLTYLVLGAVMGPVAVSIAEKFFNEYSWSGDPGYFVLINAGKQAMLLLPVIWLMTRPAWRDSSSITDAFLAAFAIGFGYDIASSLIASAPRDSVSGFGFLPPGMYSPATGMVAGYGWWTGTIAVVVALVRRLSADRWPAYVAGAVLLLLFATDQTMLAPGLTTVPPWWDTITFHRNAPAWLCPLLLVLCVVLEWIRTKGREPGMSLAAEFQAVVKPLAALRLQEAHKAGARFRLGRQLDVVRAELGRRPNDSSLASLAAGLEGQVMLAQQPAAANPPLTVKALLRRRTHYLAFIVLALLLGVVVSLPFMQPLGNHVWQWFLFSDRWAPFQLNIVATLLLAWMTWSYLTSPPPEYQGLRADEMAQFYGERAIVQTGLAVFLVATIYEAPPLSSYVQSSPAEFISFASPFTTAAGLASNVTDTTQAGRWITVLLILLCAATTMTARRWELWRSAPQPARLRTSVRHMLTALRIGMVAWPALVLFSYAQLLAHLWFAKYAKSHWDPSKHAPLGLDIRNWNSALGLASALVSVPAILGFVWLAAWSVQRINAFLFSDAPGPAPQQTAKRSSAAPGHGS